MILLQPRLLVIFYLVVLGLFLVFEARLWWRSRGVVLAPDRGFGRKLLGAIAVGQLVAMLCLRYAPQFNFGTFVVSCIGITIMVVGIALRWWAIIHLGRFFTVYLRVTSDQHVVDNGPYRLVRHPSYTGLLLFFIGWGVCFGNWLSVLAIVVPVVAMTIQRIRNEETLLLNEFGDTYRGYMHRTKRLVPLLF